MQEKLTDKQKIVYDLLRDFIVDNGKSPTIEELQDKMIKEGLKAKSKRTVTQYLDYLQEKGFIKRTGGSRGIKLVESLEKVAKPVPVLGTANAGDPVVFAEEEYQGFLRVSKQLLPKKENLFTVKIAGNSMNLEEVDGQKLEDGAYAVVDPESCDPYGNSGSPYLFSVDECATIKNFKVDDNKIVLYSNSTSEHEPIILHREDDFHVLGEVVQAFNF